MSFSFILILVLFAAYFGLTRLIVNPRDKRKLHDNPLVYWISVVINLSFAITIFYLRTSGLDFRTLQWLMIGFLVISCSLYAFLEWRYIRETRRHIATLSLMALTLMVIGSFSLLPSSWLL